MTKPADADSALQLLFAIAEAAGEAFGLEEQVATALAEPLVQALRKRWACETLYVPAPDRTSRDQEIRQAFNGRNGAEVRRRYGISRATLYRIIKARG